jgi:hypothetical protein
VGEAVNAMGLNGLGCITQARSRVPCFFQHQPTSRLISPRVPPTQRHDDALGRALEMPSLLLASRSSTASWPLPLPSASDVRLAVPLSLAPAFRSLGAPTAMRPLTNRCFTAPGATAAIIGPLSTRCGGNSWQSPRRAFPGSCSRAVATAARRQRLVR